jgi:hypothetical protein
MPALGQERISSAQGRMSALPPKADIDRLRKSASCRNETKRTAAKKVLFNHLIRARRDPGIVSPSA